MREICTSGSVRGDWAAGHEASYTGTKVETPGLCATLRSPLRPRDADIALFAFGSAEARIHHGEDMKVSVHGDAAVATGREILKGTYKGVFGELALLFTNVLVQRDGRWQLVTHQSTAVHKK